MFGFRTRRRVETLQEAVASLAIQLNELRSDLHALSMQSVRQQQTDVSLASAVESELRVAKRRFEDAEKRLANLEEWRG